MSGYVCTLQVPAPVVDYCSNQPYVFQSKTYSRVVDAELDVALQALWLLQRTADVALFPPQQLLQLSEASPSTEKNCQGKPSADSLVSFKYQVESSSQGSVIADSCVSFLSSSTPRSGICHDAALGMGWFPVVVENALMSLKPGESIDVAIDSRFPLVARGFSEFRLDSLSSPTLSLNLISYSAPKPSAKLTANRVPIFAPPLSKQRRIFVANILNAVSPISLIDLGCGEGKLLASLVCRTEAEYSVPSLQCIAGGFCDRYITFYQHDFDQNLIYLFLR
jgi:hypothetical protein